MGDADAVIHPTADVSPRARVGRWTRVWHHAQIREGAVVGQECIVGKGVYIDFDVVVGDRVKIQNGAMLYHGATVESGVFIGPQACLTNDRVPRAITPGGSLQTAEDWTVGRILIRYGASIGAGAIVLPDVTVGRFAMVAAGAVVSRSVPDHGLVVGVPARLVGYACRCGHRMAETPGGWRCLKCNWGLRPSEEGS